VLDGLAYVLRNAAPGLRLVVASRIDPLLPLHRYRLTGELTEIRASDLAFTVPEARLLMEQHGVTVSALALEHLTRRAEGWAAVMRLAAISMDGHADPDQFVKELIADDTAVAGFLVEEVPLPLAVRGGLAPEAAARVPRRGAGPAPASGPVVPAQWPARRGGPARGTGGGLAVRGPDGG
jgi:ATP/maltotriose-dependent transcriptional regulator MalT